MSDRRKRISYLGPVAVEQAIASALSLPGQGHLTAETGDYVLANLMSREGTNSRKAQVVQEAEAEPARQVNEGGGSTAP